MSENSNGHIELTTVASLCYFCYCVISEVLVQKECVY